MRNLTRILILALIATAFLCSHDAARAAERTATRGEPRNRWRYEFYSGRWWYWKRDAQWSYFDGRRWVDWGREPPQPTGGSRQIAGGSTDQSGGRALGYRALGVYPFNYSGANAPSGALPSNNTSARPGAGTASGFGSGTIAGGGVGVGLETGSRSGDASSGVGGGAVGGADVSGWNQRK